MPESLPDPFKDHPLCQGRVYTSHVYWDWVTGRFGHAQTVHDACSALHYGYEVSDTVGDERDIFYLKVADGHVSSALMARGEALGPGSSVTVGKNRVTIARKAFVMLCGNFFKAATGGLGDPATRAAFNAPLRDTVLWFLDPARGNVATGCGLPYPEHRKEQFLDFVKGFCANVWKYNGTTNPMNKGPRFVAVAECIAARPRTISILAKAELYTAIGDLPWTVDDHESLSVLRALTLGRTAFNHPVTLRECLAGPNEQRKLLAQAYLRACAKIAEGKLELCKREAADKRRIAEELAKKLEEAKKEVEQLEGEEARLVAELAQTPESMTAGEVGTDATETLGGGK